MRSDFFQNFDFLGAFFKFQIFKIFFSLFTAYFIIPKRQIKKKGAKMQSDFFQNFEFLGAFFKFQIFKKIFSHFTAYIIIQKRQIKKKGAKNAE